MAWTPGVWHAIIFPVIMMAMFTRLLVLPDRSFFLFGPRATGKTTWLRSKLHDARWYNRFLEVAALANGQVTNIAAIARDAATSRPTVQGYFDVLVDTLIGSWLRPLRIRAKVKEIAHPKFYFFDTGVVRSLGRRLREPMEMTERGPLLETLVFHELRAFQSVSSCGGEFSYWRTPSGTEVDFIWKRGGRAVGIEVKGSPRWRSEHAAGLPQLLAAGIVQRAFAVYLGETRLEDRGVQVFPVVDYLRELAAGRIIG